MVLRLKIQYGNNPYPGDRISWQEGSKRRAGIIVATHEEAMESLVKQTKGSDLNERVKELWNVNIPEGNQRKDDLWIYHISPEGKPCISRVGLERLKKNGVVRITSPVHGIEGPDRNNQQENLRSWALHFAGVHFSEADCKKEHGPNCTPEKLLHFVAKKTLESYRDLRAIL